MAKAKPQTEPVAEPMVFPREVRTTMQPETVIVADLSAYTDLQRWGLLIDGNPAETPVEVVQIEAPASDTTEGE